MHTHTCGNLCVSITMNEIKRRNLYVLNFRSSRNIRYAQNKANNHPISMNKLLITRCNERSHPLRFIL